MNKIISFAGNVLLIFVWLGLVWVISGYLPCGRWSGIEVFLGFFGSFYGAFLYLGLSKSNDIPKSLAFCLTPIVISLVMLYLMPAGTIRRVYLLGPQQFSGVGSALAASFIMGAVAWGTSSITRKKDNLTGG